MQQVETTMAEELRDTGIEMVSSNAGQDWMERATDLCSKYFHETGPDGALFERAKEYAYKAGLGHPPSQNAWGAVCRLMSMQGLITKTGRYERSAMPASHARENPVWRWSHELTH